MAEFQSIILSENAVVDTETKQLTLVNIIEEINVPSVPILYPVLRAVTVWTRSNGAGDEELEFRLKIKYPSGAFLDGTNFNFSGTLPEGKRRLRAIAVMQGIPLRELGDTLFIVELKNGTSWREVGKYSIEIKHIVV